jgi:hypothetical protein
MVRWTITPFVRVGPIMFGMQRTEVHNLLGAEFRVFRKTTTSETDAEAFDRELVHVYYDKESRVQSVELFDLSTVAVDGHILGQALTGWIECITGLGYQVQPIPSGYCVPSIGLSSFTADSKRVESNMVFSLENFQTSMGRWHEVMKRRQEREERRVAKGAANPLN